jgi:MFS family permease
MVQAVDLPARLSFLPDLVPKADLINAVGLNSLLFNCARAFGPALTGLLFFVTGLAAPRLFPGSDPVIVGAVCCFSFNSISFVAVLLALLRIHIPPDDVHRNRNSEPSSTWDGVRYLTNHSALGGLVILTLTFCVFAWPTLTLFPGYTREQLGRAESAYSGLVSALGVGALFAALATATFGSASRKGLFLVLGVATTAAGIAGLAAVNVLAAAAVCSAAIGFGLILFLSTGQSTLQLAVPNEKRGRVMAIWAMTLSASAPIGHLLAGQAAEAFGIRSVLTVMAAGTGLVAAALAVLVIRRGRVTSGRGSSPVPIPSPDSERPGAASAPVPPS